jgi:hypothetical protein
MCDRPHLFLILVLQQVRGGSAITMTYYTTYYDYDDWCGVVAGDLHIIYTCILQYSSSSSSSTIFTPFYAVWELGAFLRSFALAEGATIYLHYDDNNA